MYRHPVVLLVVGPIWQFGLKHRMPLDVPRSWKRELIGVQLTNLGLAAVVAALIWTVGLKAFLLIQIPISLIAGSVGIYLFYVQHQYEDTYWRYREAWNYYAAGLEGASHLAMPKLLPVGDGEHRAAPHPPRREPHPELQPAARVRRDPGAAPRDAAAPGRERAHAAPHAVG